MVPVGVRVCVWVTLCWKVVLSRAGSPLVPLSFGG